MAARDALRRKAGLTQIQLRTLKDIRKGRIVHERMVWWRLHEGLRFFVAAKIISVLRQRGLVARFIDNGRAVLTDDGAAALALAEGKAA